VAEGWEALRLRCRRSKRKLNRNFLVHTGILSSTHYAISGYQGFV